VGRSYEAAASSRRLVLQHGGWKPPLRRLRPIHAPLPGASAGEYADEMKESAGTLLYRMGSTGLEVLLVHASGNYNRKAPWGIPKGEPDAGEELEAAARRETEEETGVIPGSLISLGEMVYRKSPKRVHAFAGPAPEGCVPRLASWEIDQARFMLLEEARKLIHPDQAVFLDRLEERLRPDDGGG
jgi:predicted NUDIX family NTP pyrophosphohydrolase